MGDLSLEGQKSRLRKELRQKSLAMPLQERLARSTEVLKQLTLHPRFKTARTLFAYVSMKGEIETKLLLEEALRQGKKVYVPRVDKARNRLCMIRISGLEELRPGSYRVLEPPFDEKRMGHPSELRLAVVPGAGFDREGGRLGRGKGYFDRFLSEASHAYKIGLAFECQMIPKVPRARHDVLMDEVLVG